MLPSYIMRDLMGLFKTLNPTTKLVNGNPSQVVEKSDNKNFLEEMYE